MAPPTCPRCGAHGRIERAGPVERTVATIAVLLERQPVVACPNGHEAAPEAAADATHAAIHRALPRARRRWLRGDACTACDAVLTMPVRRTQRPVTVSDPALPVLTLHLDVPLTRCPDCALEQVPVRSQPDLDALADALFPATPPDDRTG